MCVHVCACVCVCVSVERGVGIVFLCTGQIVSVLAAYEAAQKCRMWWQTAVMITLKVLKTVSIVAAKWSIGNVIITSFVTLNVHLL